MKNKIVFQFKIISKDGTFKVGGSIPVDKEPTRDEMREMVHKVAKKETLKFQAEHKDNQAKAFDFWFECR